MLLPLVACTSTSASDVVGPFTGATHRYVIDSYAIPTTNAASHAAGDDLNGDGVADNQIGQVFELLSTIADLQTHADAMRAVLPSTFLIQANDLQNDDRAGVSYLGHPGDTAVPVGGTFVDGVFASNRATSDHPAEGAIVLPVFADADPTTFVLSHGEIDLTPDATGYTAVLRGLVKHSDVLAACGTGIAQMIQDDPHDHASFAIDMDANGDGNVIPEEVATSPTLNSFIAPDIDGALSIGFGVHLIACDSGDCITAAPSDTCHDRVLDGDETSIDCGGSCQACGYDTACRVAADCQSGACTNGMCAAPTCSDGIQNGVELGVDCGPAVCGKCPNQECATDADCHGGTCEYQVCL